MEWKRAFGKPNIENIGKWVTNFEESCINGCNKHLGYDPIVLAKVRLNSGIPHEIVEIWIRKEHKPEPMFQVIA